MMKRLLIVEGYMDAISLFQRGITNVVASLGTALTDAQGRLLRRPADCQAHHRDRRRYDRHRPGHGRRDSELRGA